MLGFVLDAELILLDADLADDQHRPAVVVAGIRKHRGQIGGAPRHRLRIAAGGEREERAERNDADFRSRSHLSWPLVPGPDLDHITFFCADCASTPASAMNSNALAT